MGTPARGWENITPPRGREHRQPRPETGKRITPARDREKNNPGQRRRNEYTPATGAGAKQVGVVIILHIGYHL